MKNLHSVFGPDYLPDRQYGAIRAHKSPVPLDRPAPTIHNTMTSDCKSKVCRARLQSVLGEVYKANQVVRTLITGIEEERVETTRHILHLKALRKYQTDKKKNALTTADVKKLFDEGTVLENFDVEMNDRPIAGPSTNQSLTSQSLSYNGFTDGDSDYIP